MLPAVRLMNSRYRRIAKIKTFATPANPLLFKGFRGA